LNKFKETFVNYVRNNETNTNIDAGWKVDAATQSITMSTGSLPDIRSKTKYKDFDWRLEYRNTANQGLFYRFLTTTLEPWETGIEVAIENNPNIANQKTAAAAAYDMFAPSVKNYNEYSTNKWNSIRIVAKADSVEHWLNGVKVVGFKYHNARFWSAYDNSKWAGYNTYTMKQPGNRNGGYIDEGYIGIQGNHGGTWYIRTMRLNADATKVAFGPEKTTGCVTALQPSAGLAGSPAVIERLSGSVRVRFPGSMSADRASLVGLDGREVANVAMEPGGQSALVSGWNRSGLYLFRAFAGRETVLREKIMLP
jgi:hypothetical protein